MLNERAISIIIKICLLLTCFKKVEALFIMFDFPPTVIFFITIILFSGLTLIALKFILTRVHELAHMNVGRQTLLQYLQVSGEFSLSKQMSSYEFYICGNNTYSRWFIILAENKSDVEIQEIIKKVSYAGYKKQFNMHLKFICLTFILCIVLLFAQVYLFLIYCCFGILLGSVVAFFIEKYSYHKSKDLKYYMHPETFEDIGSKEYFDKHPDK